MSTATLGNAAHILTIASQKGITLEACSLLVQSGFQADLFEAAVEGTLGTLDRDGFRRLIGLSPLMVEPIILEVNYNEDLEAMIAAGSYSYRNSNINAERFPISGKGIVRFEAKLVHPNRYISSDAVEGQIKDLDASNPWDPAGIEHLLTFGELFPDEQRKYPIIALGSVAEVVGRRYVPYLSRDGSGRNLDLSWLDGDWPASCRFLAVRKVSVPSAT